jgi:hypothetical protein
MRNMFGLDTSKRIVETLDVNLAGIATTCTRGKGLCKLISGRASLAKSQSEEE